MPPMMDLYLHAEAYPFNVRRAEMICFLPLLRFTFEGALRSSRSAAREFTRRRRTMTTESKFLEGHQLKRGPEQHPAHVDSSNELGYRLASRGRQKHEYDRLG